MFLLGRGSLSGGEGGCASRELPVLTSSGGNKAGGTHPTGMHCCYRPQTKFAKVMFLHVSVSHSVHRGGGRAWQGVHGLGGVHVGVCVSVWGACMPGGGGVHGREACMAGGMHATCLGGHVWKGGMHGRGHACHARPPPA